MGFPFFIRVLIECTDVDLNDPQTLQFYSQLLLFRDDHSREALIFPPTLSPQQRRIVHTLAHHMGLAHISRGNGEGRQVHVFRAPQGQTPNISSPSIPTVHPVENHNNGRRGLARATTMDFTDTRSESAAMYSIGRQASTMLDIPSSPSGREHSLQSRQQNLRAAKSFADLRSYTPSPAPSSASFPASLGNNISRYQQEYGAHSVTSTTPTLTPTATGNNHNESLLVNGLAGVSLSSLGGNLGVAGGSLRGDPRDPRGVLSHERERGGDGHISGHSGTPGGGVTRSFSMGFDEVRAERDRLINVIPQRQPRGPDSDRGFAGRNRQHHSGRGGSGGELDVQSGVEIVVE